MGNDEENKEMDGSDADDVEETVLEDEIEEDGLAGIVEDGTVESTYNDVVPGDGIPGLTPEVTNEDDASDDDADLLGAEAPKTEDLVDEGTAKYRFVNAINRPDASGTPQLYPIGSIVELPISAGSAYVETGEAELVVE